MMEPRRVFATLRTASRMPALLSGLTVFLVAPAAAQQQGAVVGTVTDAETLQPVSGAQIYVPGIQNRVYVIISKLIRCRKILQIQFNGHLCPELCLATKGLECQFINFHGTIGV